MNSKWSKSDPALAARFDAALPEHPAVQRKKMFGYPVCFVRGNFFAGLHEDTVVVRLPGALRARFLGLIDAEVFDPMGTGKGMTDWWVIPAAVAGNYGTLAGLLADTFAEALELPEKEPETKRAVKDRVPRSRARPSADAPSRGPSASRRGRCG
jgi:TfoX N-terminal domain